MTIISYLHYYFANADMQSSFGSADYNEAKQKEILMQQKRLFDLNRQRNTSQLDTQKFGSAIEFLMGNSAESSIVRENVYNQSASANTPVPIDFSVGGVSIGSLGSRGKAALAKAQEIASNIDLFNNGLSNALTQAVTLVNSNLDEYKTEVIKSYVQAKGLSSDLGGSELAQRIIQDFLIRDGLSFLKDSSSSLNTVLNKLTLLATALPEFKSGMGSSFKYNTGSKKTLKSISSDAEFINVLAGKCSGLWNNIKGAAGEMAVLQGELAVAKRAAKGFAGVQAEITGNKRVAGSQWANISRQTKVNDDMTEMLKLKDMSLSEHVSKADVTVTLTENDVIVNYGLSVKEFKPASPDTNGVIGKVTIQDNTSFLESANRTFSGNGIAYMYNLAGGHGNSNVDLEGVPTYSNEDLNSMWRQLKETVVISNFLYYLVGLPKENVYFLVGNKRVYDMSDIIDSVVGNPKLLESNFKMVSRETMMRTNRWVDRTEGKAGTNRNMKSAKARSESAIKSINSYLERAKITISLSLLMNYA